VNYEDVDMVSLSASDVNLVTTGSVNAEVEVSELSPTSWLVSLSEITGDGTLAISIAEGTATAGSNSAPAVPASTPILVDNTPPTTGSVTVAEYFTAAPLSVSYSGVSDAGSGLESVRLWARVGSGDWVYTGLSSAFAADTFSFPATTNGPYAFAVQGVDTVGNVSAAPTGNGEATTILDTAPPIAGSLSGPAMTNTSPVTLNFSGASDPVSGLAQVELWARKPNGGWNPTGLVSQSGSGSFQYAGFELPGSYSFALRAHDQAGNVSSTPNGTGQLTVAFNNLPPQISSVSAPPYANETPISVQFTGDDSVDTARLWVRRGSAAWQETNLTVGGSSGSFAFTGVNGDAQYAFAVQVGDAFGNLSPTPQGAGMAATIYDTTAPQIGSITAPEGVNETPIPVVYNGVTDGEGSGVQSVELWVRKDAGPWAATGMTRNNSSGTFHYPAAEGDGEYAFALRARDRAGNESPEPTGAGLAQTTLDSTFTPGKLAAPEFATELPIELSYSDASAGEQAAPVIVHLWVKVGEEGTWQETGLTATGESGEFAFDAADSEGHYFFGLQAENDAGERSQAPQLLGQAATLYDATPPEGVITSPTIARELPVRIEYEADDGEGSGVERVRIWVKQGPDGEWEDTGLVLTEAEGAIEYDAMDQDDHYYFAIQVTDLAGLQSAEPSDDMIGDLLAQAN
jgi:hypothetical protein